MSYLTNHSLDIYDGAGVIVYSTTAIVEASGNSRWHEIGSGSYVIVPAVDQGGLVTSSSGAAQLAAFAPNNRIEVRVTDTVALTTHLVCDFLIESVDIVEQTTDNGATVFMLRADGRDRIKQLLYYPVNARCLSLYYDSLSAATAVTGTTLQMSGADTAAHGAGTLVNWTIELADGNWSTITDHTAGGLLTIDPGWPSFTTDEITPPAQAWKVYGTQLTPTTGTKTDIKQAMSYAGWSWVYDPQGYASTQTGTFTTPNGAHLLQVLQQIASQSGEYFWRTPGTSKIFWARAPRTVGHPQYGGQVILRKWDTTISHDWQNAYILPGASMRTETYERVTRVRPTGAGSGDETLTLKDLPAGYTPYAGYTIDGEYLVNTAQEAGGDYVAKDLDFTWLDAANDSIASRELAAQMLAKAAHVWIQERLTERKIITCEVISHVPIYPVATVYVEEQFYGKTGTYYVMSSTAVLRGENLIYQLELSDKKAPLLDDARILTEYTLNHQRQRNAVSAPRRNSRAMDRQSTGSTSPGDHDPVTALNSAITVTGQAVGVQLGTPSGLQIDNGLKLDNTIAGAGLSISNKIMAVDLAVPSGLLLSSGLQVDNTIAGDGLTITNKVLAVGTGANSGVNVTADAISITAGTITKATTNANSGGTHTHAVTTTDNAKTTPNTILAGSAAGDLTTRYVTADRVYTPMVLSSSGEILIDPANGVTSNDGNLSFIGARAISTTSGSLTLQPATDLMIQPSGNATILNPSVTLKTNHWSSGFLGTGWGVTYAGAADFRSIYADELRVTSFIADTARVQVGSEYIVPSMGLISRLFTIPAAGSSATLYIEDAPGLPDLPLFVANDWVLLRMVSRVSNTLKVFNIWGQVTTYTDLTNGEQSWTFTTRSVNSSAIGWTVPIGSTALSFGKSGAGWIWSTTTEPGGSPYIGMTTWQGANPYDEGNRTHRIRLGQLLNLSAVNEWGLQAGSGTSQFVRFSDMRSEIHGTRLSLYAGDSALLQVSAVDVLFWKTSGGSQSLIPNADHSSLNIVSSAAINYYATVDETVTAPNHADYIGNAANTNAFMFLGLTNPTTYTGSIYQVQVRAAVKGTNFSTDTIRLYAQVFRSDQYTPLTGEVLVRTQTDNTTPATITVTFPHHDETATAAQWNDARLRLRWEYTINASKEAIRLDPNVPSLAIGENLPTGFTSGGAGFWAGKDNAYKVRIGNPNGISLRWNGYSLEITGTDGNDVIQFNGNGNSSIDGVLTLGTSGGIWQGTGTFTSPTTGLKIWNNSGIGRLATYNAGTQQVLFNSNGQLVAGAGNIVLDDGGLSITVPEDYYSKSSVQFASTGSLDAKRETTAFIAKTMRLHVQQALNTNIGASLKLVSDTDYVTASHYATLDAGEIELTAARFIRLYTSEATGEVFVDRSTFVLDQAAADGYAFKIRASTDVAHGMTALAATDIYSALGKHHATNGGVAHYGFSAGTVAMSLNANATTANTAASTSAFGAIEAKAALKSGTTAGNMGASDNLFVVKNNADAKFIVKGNGNFHYDGTGAAYDSHDDIGLLRTLSREVWAGTIDDAWDKFVTYNRKNLIDAGVMSDSGFINGPALNRLLVGALWQVHTRLAVLENNT